MKFLLLPLSFLTLSASAALGQEIPTPNNLFYLRNAPSYDELTLFWSDNSDNETGFVIESKTDGGDWEEVAQTTADVENYTFTGLAPGPSVNYRVKAVNAIESSDYSAAARVVGTLSELEVYPEVPDIRTPKTHTINGITFSELQDQCPAEPERGKATRISTFYRVEVRPADGGDWQYSPTYETRPQIRDMRAQNDPAHSGGHDVYAYGNYGPNRDHPNRGLHSRHWNNFDAATEISVRISLLPGAPSQTINLSQTEIFPAPLAVNQVDDSTLEVTLPAAGTKEVAHAKHYMITFNRNSWQDPSRGPLVYEHPLMLFVNPVKPAPASAPEGSFRVFNGGKLMVLGPGIHLPDNRWRFLGPGENGVTEEVYIPGDAYVHGGFVLNNPDKSVRVWGRGIYSDELFLVHQPADNNPQRTPWATIPPAEGNAWNIGGSWEASVFFKGGDHPQILEGLSSISRRMGSVTDNGGNAVLIDHKDVAYAGGLFQRGNSKSEYLGIFTVNDDDITYCHEDYEMRYCTSRNFHNGPSFQFGWGVNNEPSAQGRVFDHTTLPSDKRHAGFGQNHGVFNSRLLSGNLFRHLGGYYENFTLWGQEVIVFNIGISNDRNINGANPVSIFSDKTFKNFDIKRRSINKNLIEAKVKNGESWESYVRFIHFDSLVIEGNHITDIDDGNHFDYEPGVLLHTITFFSLPDPVTPQASTTDPVGRIISFQSQVNDLVVQPDATLPASLSPLCANSPTQNAQFRVVDAGDGYVALQAQDGYFVKADAERYGYVHTRPDALRGDPDVRAITEDAKFKWIDLGGDEFALYAKSTGLYVRAESNSGPEMPLYAASAQLGNAETFSTRLAVSTDPIADPSTWTLSPNPTQGRLLLQGDQTKSTQISIYSLQGRLIRNQWVYNPAAGEVDVEKLPSGVYLLVIHTEQGSVIKQFVKQR